MLFLTSEYCPMASFSLVIGYIQLYLKNRTEINFKRFLCKFLSNLKNMLNVPGYIVEIYCSTCKNIPSCSLFDKNINVLSRRKIKSGNLELYALFVS